MLEDSEVFREDVMGVSKGCREDVGKVPTPTKTTKTNNTIISNGTGNNPNTKVNLVFVLHSINTITTIYSTTTAATTTTTTKPTPSKVLKEYSDKGLL